MTFGFDASGTDNRAMMMLFGAWIIALLSTFAVLFIGEVIGQTPCNLCWFQRAFMFPLAIILGVAAWRSDTDIWRYAAPVAAIGGVIALYHTLLYSRIVPAPITPCTATGPSCTDDAMLTLGVPIPALSLLAFGAILALLISIRRTSS